jgi:hypothetical protein
VSRTSNTPYNRYRNYRVTELPPARASQLHAHVDFCNPRMLPNCLTVQPERVQNLPSSASSATLLQPDSAGTDRAREKSLDRLPSSVSPCLVRNSMPERPLLRFGLKPIYMVPCGRVRPHPGRTLAWRPGQPPVDAPFEMVLVQVPRNPRVSVRFVRRRPLAPDPISPPWLPTRAPFLASNPSSFRGCEPELVSWLRTRVRSSAGVRSTFPSAHRFGLLRQVPVRLGAAPRSVWALGQRATTPTLECVQRSKGAPRFLPACNRAPLSGLPCAEVLCGRLRWECAQARSTHPTHRSVYG